MKRLMLISLILLPFYSSAAIYINKTKDGSIEYSDTPTQTSKKIEIPSVSSITVPKPTTTIAPTQSPATETNDDEDVTEPSSNANTYSKFEIISPKNGGTIQNQPVIPVDMVIEPNMLPGDKIQLMLDNTPVGTPTATSYQEIGLVERGEHSLYAVIKNNKDQVIKKSSTITIHVHRNSKITSPTSK